MKKVLFIIIGLIVLCAVGFFTFNNISMGKEITNMNDKKVLVAYYSYSGNTEKVAKKIQNLTNGDLFEIVPKQPYSNNYNEVVALAQQEKQKDVRPELIDNGDVSGYDIIFIGTPVWWYTMATPVKTFIANNDFSGKIIVPFCTHGGGGASSTYIDMQKLAPNAKVLTGYTSYEDTAKDNEITSWINNLKF